jgi:hypothetical protein
VKAGTVSLRCAAVSETQGTAALWNFNPGYVRVGSKASQAIQMGHQSMSGLPPIVLQNSSLRCESAIIESDRPAL